MRLSNMKIMVLFWSTSVEKEIVALSLLSFSLIFFIWAFSLFFMAPFFIWASLASFILFRPESHTDLWGNHSLHHPFPHLGQCSKMKIITLLFSYNSTITTRYLEQNMTIWMPPAVYRDMQWIKSDMYERIMNGGFATNTMSTTWSCKQYDNDGMCHNNGTMESCMAIYLGMAMEMP